MQSKVFCCSVGVMIWEIDTPVIKTVLKGHFCPSLKKKVTSVRKKTVLSWKRHFYQKFIFSLTDVTRSYQKRHFCQKTNSNLKLYFKVTLWFKSHVKLFGLRLTLLQISRHKSKFLHLPKYLHTYYPEKNRKG